MRAPPGGRAPRDPKAAGCERRSRTSEPGAYRQDQQAVLGLGPGFEPLEAPPVEQGGRADVAAGAAAEELEEQAPRTGAGTQARAKILSAGAGADACHALIESLTRRDLAKPSQDSAPTLLVTELWGLGDLALAVPFLRAASRPRRVVLVAKPHAAPILARFAPGGRARPSCRPLDGVPRESTGSTAGPGASSAARSAASGG